MVGKEIRLERIMDRESHLTVIIPMDHGITMGPIPGLADIKTTIDKIVEGKLAKFFKDNCLVSQPFVKDDTKTVGQALEDAAKAAGGTAKIKKFVRIEIG